MRAKDRLESETSLPMLGGSVLDRVMRSFVKGIIDSDLKKEVARGFTSTTRSLRGLRAIAEQAKCTKLEVSMLGARD